MKSTNAEPHERRLDPRDNPRRLTHQGCTLAARSLGILFSKRRHSHHLAMAALAPQPTEKSALQKLNVEPISLRPAVFARHRHARCMNDVRLDGACGKPARQPE